MRACPADRARSALTTIGAAPAPLGGAGAFFDDCRATRRAQQGTSTGGGGCRHDPSTPRRLSHIHALYLTAKRAVRIPDDELVLERLSHGPDELRAWLSRADRGRRTLPRPL